MFDYLDSLKWNISFVSTLNYLNNLKLNYSPAYYSKQFFQIKKFLIYLDLSWSNKLENPKPVHYLPKRVNDELVQECLNFFKNDIQIQALINLGKDSGLRAEELYQLTIDDIDIINRIVYVRNDRNHSVKTGLARVSFFTNKTAKILHKYFNKFDKQNKIKNLWNINTIQKKFRNASLKVKFLRKYFSQTWDRKGGSTGIKKIIMGHSLKNDIDLMHYNYQSEEDLKRIYDKIML